MPARIVVQSGVATGATYWIENSVTRIGSDAQADISLPSLELEPHVATIEYRHGRYRVHNRSPKPLFVGGQTLEPQQFLFWHEADLLELPDGTQLAMECDSDGAPSPTTNSTYSPSREPTAAGQYDELRQHSDYDTEHAESGSSETTSGRNAPREPATMHASPNGEHVEKKLLPWLVIAGCIVGSALLLLRTQRKADSTPGQAVPAFEVVVRAAREEASQVSTTLLSQLQYAEAALVAGNKKSATERYGRLRYQLLEFREQEAATTQQVTLTVAQQQVATLIEDRLGRLGK